MAVSGTARAQDETETFPCIAGLELPAELAELDLAGLQAALQALVTENPDATVTLLFEGEEVATVRADLLLADEAVLTALLEGQAVNVTLELPELVVIVGIEVSTAEDCVLEFCTSGIELPAALAALDVAGLRAALEEMVAENADATVTVPDFGGTIIRADLLLGLEDPALEALLAGEPLSVSLDIRGEPFEIVGITLPEEGEQCEGPTGPPEVEPKPGDIQDDQQGGDEQDDQQGSKPTAPNNQQTGGTDTGAGKSPDNQEGGDDAVTKTFRLTLNGTVPEGQVFGVVYGTSDNPEVFNQIIFCGQSPGDLGTPSQEPDCRGGGTVYEERVTLAKGTGIIFVYFRSTEDVSEEPEDFVFEQFHTGEEVLQDDLVNNAWYTFRSADDGQQNRGKDTAAGDAQQGDTQGDGVSAGEDTQDGQQGTGAGDTQGDQQVEVPAAMPSTGAGGTGGASGIPVGAAAGMLLVLTAGGYAMR